MKIEANKNPCRQHGGDNPEPRDTTRAVVERLRRQIEDERRRRAVAAGWVPYVVPTGLPAIDRRLPGGGLPGGTVIEVLSHHQGVGAMALAARIATRCMERAPESSPEPSRGLYAVVVDSAGDFYPPAAAAWGMPLERLVVVRTRAPRAVFWTVDQCLRCEAVAVVVASVRSIEERVSRRLQLAAERTGAMAVIIRPTCEARGFAGARLLVTPEPPTESPCAPPCAGAPRTESPPGFMAPGFMALGRHDRKVSPHWHSGDWWRRRRRPGAREPAQDKNAQDKNTRERNAWGQNAWGQNDRNPDDRNPDDRNPDDRNPDDQARNAQARNDRPRNDWARNDWARNDWARNEWGYCRLAILSVRGGKASEPLSVNLWQQQDHEEDTLPPSSLPVDGQVVFDRQMAKTG